MDCINEPFIKVLYLNGCRSTVGLRSLLLDAHLIRCIDEHPIFQVSVIRLVMAILYRSFKNDDPASQILTEGVIDQRVLDKYLKSVAQRFDLYGNHPFLQVADLVTYDGKKQVAPKSCSFLQWNQPSGNNAVLFTPGPFVPSVEQMAKTLLCGLLNYQTGNQPKSNFCDKNRYAKFSPAAGATLFLACGNNLLMDIVLNMPSYSSLCEKYRQDSDTDLPCWEREEVPMAARKCHGPMDYLTWLASAIRLLPPENGLVPGVFSTCGDTMSQPADDFMWITVKNRKQESVYRTRPLSVDWQFLPEAMEQIHARWDLANGIWTVGAATDQSLIQSFSSSRLMFSSATDMKDKIAQARRVVETAKVRFWGPRWELFEIGFWRQLKVAMAGLDWKMALRVATEWALKAVTPSIPTGWEQKYEAAICGDNEQVPPKTVPDSKTAPNHDGLVTEFHASKRTGLSKAWIRALGMRKAIPTLASEGLLMYRLSGTNVATLKNRTHASMAAYRRRFHTELVGWFVKKLLVGRTRENAVVNELRARSEEDQSLVWAAGVISKCELAQRGTGTSGLLEMLGDAYRNGNKRSMNIVLDLISSANRQTTQEAILSGVSLLRNIGMVPDYYKLMSEMAKWDNSKDAIADVWAYLFVKGPQGPNRRKEK